MASSLARRGATALLLATLLTAACAGFAKTLDARVGKVADGDTITVVARGDDVTIRLLYIDAPEHDQPWGRESKRGLQELVRLAPVRVDTRGKDRYGRTLGHVTRRGDNLDVNLELVRRGLAWANARGAMRMRYEAAEAEARSARRGLWQDARPIAPQVWRHRKR